MGHKDIQFLSPCELKVAIFVEIQAQNIKVSLVLEVFAFLMRNAYFFFVTAVITQAG